MDDFLKAFRSEIKIPGPENSKREAQLIRRHFESTGEPVDVTPEGEDDDNFDFANAVISGCRVADYDFGRNALAEESHRSFDLGVNCLVCDQPIAITKRVHQKWLDHDKKLMMVCSRCFLRKGVGACEEHCRAKLKGEVIETHDDLEETMRELGQKFRISRMKKESLELVRETLDDDGNVQIPEGHVCVVMRVPDYDMSLNSTIPEESQSHPREGLACPLCEEPLVCRNMLWKAYQIKKMPIICLRCAQRNPSSETLRKIEENEDDQDTK